MYKRDFEGLLGAKKLPKAIFLYGECNFQNNHFAQKILDQWLETGDEALRFYYDEFDFSAAKNHLAQSSLFGGVNVVLIKTDKAIGKKELDTLIALTQKSQNSFLLFQYFGESKKAATIAKSFGKNFVRFFSANQGEAVGILQTKAKEMHLDIHAYALTHLFELHQHDLSLCVNELSKLSLLDHEISVADIDRMVYGLGSVAMDSFIEKLLQKEDIKQDFLILSESGAGDEVRLINAMQSYISGLLMFHLYIKIHGNFDARAILGYPLPPQIAKQRAAHSIKIPLKTYQKMLAHLALSEHALKKAKNIDKNSYLISALIKLQTFL